MPTPLRGGLKLMTACDHVAATVDQKSSAVASIAEGVGRASDEARVGAEAMTRVAEVTASARSTAPGVKDLADSVAVEAESLEAEVRQFLDNVQAAWFVYSKGM